MATLRLVIICNGHNSNVVYGRKNKFNGSYEINFPVGEGAIFDKVIINFLNSLNLNNFTLRRKDYDYVARFNLSTLQKIFGFRSNYIAPIVYDFDENGEIVKDNSYEIWKNVRDNGKDLVIPK